MNDNTRAELAALTPESTVFAIRNDKDIRIDSLSIIIDKLNSCPKLRQIIFTGCGLTDMGMSLVVKAIAGHSYIERADLSDHSITDYSVFEPLLKNKRMYSLDISKSGMVPDPDSYYYFLQKVKENDHIVSLGLPFDPSAMKNSKGDRGIDLFREGWKNIVECNLPEVTNTVIADLGQRNSQEAERLLALVIADGVKNIERLAEIQARLPAILYFNRCKAQPKKVIASLLAMEIDAWKQYGVSLDAKSYMNVDKVPSVKSRAGVDPFCSDGDVADEVTKLPSLSHEETLKKFEKILESLPNYTEDEIQAKLNEGRANPMQLMKVGSEITAVLSDIAFASLDAAGSSVSMEMPVRSMADFVNAMGKARSIMEGIVGGRPLARETPDNDGGLWRRVRQICFGNTVKDLYSLADASAFSHDAGKILHGMREPIAAMAGNLYSQLETRLQIIDLYRKADEQICKIRNVSAQQASVWRQEDDQAETPLWQADGRDEKPVSLPVKLLNERVSLFDQLHLQAEGNVARHMMDWSVEQKHQQFCENILVSNILMLAEQVATFIAQVDNLGRVTFVNGVADVISQTAELEGNIYVLAARETVKSIEKLTNSTQQALDGMRKNVDVVASQGIMPKLSPLYPPPPSVAREDVTGVKKIDGYGSKVF